MTTNNNQVTFQFTGPNEVRDANGNIYQVRKLGPLTWTVLAPPSNEFNQFLTARRNDLLVTVSFQEWRYRRMLERDEPNLAQQASDMEASADWETASVLLELRKEYHRKWRNAWPS
jgi:hypothetical protein